MSSGPGQINRLNRRNVLALMAGGALLPFAHSAQAQVITAQLRGSISAVDLGLTPSAADDQSRALQNALDVAAAEGRALYLPAGRYFVSNINLPSRTRLYGVAGSTRLIYTGAGHLLAAAEGEMAHFADLVFDGANRPLGEYVPGILHLANVADVRIEGCAFLGSGGSAIAVDRCGGRITGNDITGAADAGVRAIESTGLSVTDNIVRDCGNNGILIHRWTEGEDGSLVIGNRVERIRADLGGTGPYGNGINVYQAHGVTVAENRIADCAFSAVRANSSDNVAILGNNCARLGEMAIYAEFSFEAAVIANNIIDGAASGISVVNFNEGGRIATITGNIVRNLSLEAPYFDDEPGFGIGMFLEADCAVSGNVIESAPRAAMWLGWGPYLRNVSVTGNVMRDSPIAIAVSVVEGVGATLIADNVIEGASEGAVVGWRWAERATGDLTQNDAGAPPSLAIRDNLIVP